MKPKLLLLGIAVILLSLSVHAGNEDECMDALVNAARGYPVEWARLSPADYANSVTNMFEHGGSENIPVLCRAARYLEQGDPAWFEEYFEYQRRSSGGNARFMGQELLSPVYGPMVSVPILAVYQESARRRHTKLNGLAREWLRTYWAVQSLGSVQNSMSTFAYIEAGTFHDNSFTIPSGCRYSMATAAARSRAAWPGAHPHQKLFNLALGSSSGSCSIGGDEGSFLSPAFIAMNARAGSTPSAEQFGLTQGERDTLKRFASTGQGVSSVISMIGGHTPPVPMTFVRTSTGVANWIGTPEEGARDGHPPTGGKPATHAIKLSSGGNLVTFYPQRYDPSGCVHSCKIGREDEQICTEFSGASELCFDVSDIAAGDYVFGVMWHPSGTWTIPNPFSDEPQCGDGELGEGEECDDGKDNGACPAACSSSCTVNFCDDGTGPECGDSKCNNGETCSSCPGDCGACVGCGNNRCNGGETCSSCPGDCGECTVQGCGDGVCSGGETCTSCRQDCGSCGPRCGDGFCSEDEGCDICFRDCGFCV